MVIKCFFFSFVFTENGLRTDKSTVNGHNEKNMHLSCVYNLYARILNRQFVKFSVKNEEEKHTIKFYSC